MAHFERRAAQYVHRSLHLGRLYRRRRRRPTTRCINDSTALLRQVDSILTDDAAPYRVLDHIGDLIERASRDCSVLRLVSRILLLQLQVTHGLANGE